MDIQKVLPHHPAATQDAATPREWVCQSRRTPLSDVMHLGGTTLQHLLGHHYLLVDAMHVPQMAAEGTGLHSFPALGALEVPCIPLGSDVMTRRSRQYDSVGS